MPSIEVTCSNPECGEKFQVGAEMAGELVECPACGASVYVLEGDEGDNALELDPSEMKKDGQEHIFHPARQQCANCGAVLGVRDAFCPECGADIRTGAAVTTTVERKKRNLVPIYIGAGILATIVALVVLVVFAVQLLQKRAAARRAAADAAAQQAAAQPVARPVAPRAPAPKPAYEIPPQVLSDLADRELALVQSVDAYLDRLRQTLADVHAGDPQSKAAAWADLYQYCAENDLQVEAEQAWYQAARLLPQDPAVRQKLGLTEDFQGVPVTPAQSEFLETLKPRLRVINRDPSLRDHVVVVGELDPVPIPLGEAVELEPEAGPIVLSVARAGRADRPIESFNLTAEPGVVQTVEIFSPSAAPSLPFDALAAIYSAVGEGQQLPQVTLVRDAGGRVVEAGYGTIRIRGSEESPVEMWLTRRGDQLALVGSIALGNRFSAEGRKLFNGTKLHPLSLTLAGQGVPLRLTLGGYCLVRADMTDGLWGMMAMADGDLSYEFMRSRLEKRLNEVSFENARLEAAGELYGPWQTTVNLYDRAKALRDELQQRADDWEKAAALPGYRDRIRALGPGRSEAIAYVNWPRFRAAIALAMQGAGRMFEERLELMGGEQPEPAPRTTQPPAGTRGVPGVRSVPFGAPQAVAEKDSEAAPMQPPPVTLDAEQRTTALLRLLPLLPDDQVLATVQSLWPQLTGQQKTLAVMALEQAATPQAIAWLGWLAQNATDTDETAMALLSLGAIGTPEALAQTELPAVAAKVRTASFVAAVVAGVPDALEQVPAFLADAGADERAAFLQYVTQFDTPGALFALSAAIDAYSDPADARRIAGALVRIGGRAAARELSRLMEKTADIYASQLARVEADSAALLVRQVGAAVAADSKADDNALAVLAADGSQASVAFLLSAALNHDNARAVEALLKIGTAPALDGAGQAARLITLQMLGDLRKRSYVLAANGRDWAWNAGVDTGAVRKLLEKVFADGADFQVRIAAAAMLSETDRPLPPDRLLAFARDAAGAAGAAPAGQFAPPGFERPLGRPRTPQGFQFDGSPAMYAIGLALEANDPGLAEELKKLADSTQDGSLKAAAMAALGRLGGRDNLEFLRNAAAAESDVSADDEAGLVNALESRLAALAGLAEAQDGAFLPRALDLLSENPPAAAGGNGELGDWWLLQLRRGAADCVAGICRQRSPLELTADSGLQTALTNRLKALIDEPGPSRDSLSAAREQLRAAAIRAFGRVADFNDPTNSFVLSRLVVDLSQQETARAPTRRPRTPSTTTDTLQASPLRLALVDAVAHAAARAQDLGEFVRYANDLVTSPQLKTVWNQTLREMSEAPPAGYFALLSATFGTLDKETGGAIFEATQDSPEAKGQQYGKFLASLVGAAEATPAPTQVAAGTGRGARRPAAAGRPGSRLLVAKGGQGMSLSQDEVQALMAENRAAGMAAAAAQAEMMPQGPATSFGPPGTRPGRTRAAGRPQIGTRAVGEVPTYKRRLPYKTADWRYNLKNVAERVAELRREWAVVRTLIERSGDVLGGVVQATDLLTRSEVGPAVAPQMVQQDSSLREGTVRTLGELLIKGLGSSKQALGPGFRASSPGTPVSAAARRAAVAALRRIGGQQAAEALYTGLVGAEATQGPAPTPYMPMPMARAGATNPVAAYIARALGSMGRDDLLRKALNAPEREFFQGNAAAVQGAALQGMAYLPPESNPLDLLAGLVQAASVEALRKAAADALVVAARLMDRQG